MRLILTLALAAAGWAGVACGTPPVAPSEDPDARALRLARDLLIVDTHVDLPYRLTERMEDVSRRTPSGHFDWERAREGGLDAAFMSIYVPASFQESGGARDKAEMLIAMVEKLLADWPDKFAPARSPEEVRRNSARGLVSLPMGMENGAPVEEDLANLERFHRRGIRYITLTHSENNQICDSSYAKERRWGGVSPFGEKVVAEMNRLGIMVDVSHLSDQAFRRVLEISRAPVIASHSSCRHFTPGWERNMDDDMIRLLAARGGVLQINFGSAFLLDEAQRQSTAFWEKFEEHLRTHELGPADPEARRFAEEYWKGTPKVRGDLSIVADHIDHVVGLVGVDHVGFGSDFDGVDTLPEGLEDVSKYPGLLRVLLERGYGEEDLRKICGENLLRVWSEVERVAAELRRGGGAS